MDPRIPERRYGRRIVWLGAFVVLVVVAYTAGWFYLAGRIESGTAATLARLGREGVELECANPAARGYPFRIGLYCDRVSFAQPTQGVAAAAGAFRSAGQIYDPMRLVAEIDGPATVAAPGVGDLALDWKTMRASARLSQPLPERVSLEGTALQVGTAAGTRLVAADSFEGHMRPNGADVDLAGRFGGLTVAPALAGGRSVPALSGDVDMTLKDGLKRMADGVSDLRGQSGLFRSLKLTLGQAGSLSVTGPFAVDEAGLIDADLRVSLTEPKALSKGMSQVFPEARRQIDQGFAGLAFLGGKPSLPLKIVKGSASLGFIPLGTIPPLR